MIIEVESGEILVEDGSEFGEIILTMAGATTIPTSESCDDIRVARLIIQEAGIPGPQGPPGTGATGLEDVTVIAPIVYDENAQELRLAPAPLPGQVYRWDGTAWTPVTLPERRVENRVITEDEANAGEFSLQYIVTEPDKILFDIAEGGGPQFLHADFVLVGNQVIRWAGGPLDGLLTSGDRVRIVYE